MSDKKEAKPAFAIQRIYLKDCSLEVPSSPEIFRTNWKPEVKVDLDVSSAELKDETSLYDVTLQVTVNVTLEGKPAFLVEVKQSGIFLIHDFPKEQVAHAIGSACPEMLFPYAREAVSDLVTKAGFPQLLLAPINFEAMYMQKMQQAEKSEA